MAALSMSSYGRYVNPGDPARRGPRPHLEAAPPGSPFGSFPIDWSLRRIQKRPLRRPNAHPYLLGQPAGIRRPWKDDPNSRPTLEHV